MRCRGLARAFDSAYPLFPYTGPLREIISAYKKGKRRSLAPFFARTMAKAISEFWPERVLVPVPPRPGKLRAQGWDQVEEILRVLEVQGFVAARPLLRLPSLEQKSLGREDRGVNAKKAYSLKEGSSSPPYPLLIDDVVTTCATLEACATALKSGGALSVAALVIAAD